MRKLYLPIGIVLLIAAAVVKLMISPQILSERFPAGWTWEVDSVGTAFYTDETNPDLPTHPMSDDPINLVKRTFSVKERNADGTLVLEDNYKTIDVITGVVTWEFSYNPVVDAKTGAYTDPAFVGQYPLFPRNVQKISYTLSNASLLHLPVNFTGEDTISGIPTYVFEYQGTLETTAAYPNIALEPEQIIQCVGLSVRYFVEPITGEIVQISESCEGEWIVDTATNKQITPVGRWVSESKGEDLIRRVDKVQMMITSYQLMNTYLPLLLGGLGSVLVGLGIWANMNRKTAPK